MGQRPRPRNFQPISPGAFQAAGNPAQPAMVLPWTGNHWLPVGMALGSLAAVEEYCSADIDPVMSYLGLRLWRKSPGAELSWLAVRAASWRGGMRPCGRRRWPAGTGGQHSLLPYSEAVCGLEWSHSSRDFHRDSRSYAVPRPAEVRHGGWGPRDLVHAFPGQAAASWDPGS